MDFKKSAFFSHCAVWFVLIDAGRLGRAQRRPGGRGAPSAWQCFVVLSSYFKATITRLFDGFFEFFLNFYFSWIFAILSYLGLKFTRARITKVASINQVSLGPYWKNLASSPPSLDGLCSRSRPIKNLLTGTSVLWKSKKN